MCNAVCWIKFFIHVELWAPEFNRKNEAIRCRRKTMGTKCTNISIIYIGNQCVPLRWNILQCLQCAYYCLFVLLRLTLEYFSLNSLVSAVAKHHAFQEQVCTHNICFICLLSFRFTFSLILAAVQLALYLFATVGFFIYPCLWFSHFFHFLHWYRIYFSA